MLLPSGVKMGIQPASAKGVATSRARSSVQTLAVPVSTCRSVKPAVRLSEDRLTFMIAPVGPTAFSRVPRRSIQTRRRLALPGRKTTIPSRDTEKRSR